MDGRRPAPDIVALSEAVVKSKEALRTELQAERTAINRLVEERHRALIKSFDDRVGPLLVLTPAPPPPVVPTVSTKSEEKFGFHTGDAVFWKSHDNDVPRGMQGSVVGFTADRAVVDFGGSLFQFRPSEIRHVAKDRVEGTESRRSGSRREVKQRLDLKQWQQGKAISIELPNAEGNANGANQKAMDASLNTQASGLSSPTALKRRGSNDWDENRPMSRMEAFVNSMGFEFFFGGVIIVNAVVLAVRQQYVGDDIGYQLGFRQEYGKYSQPASETWPDAYEVFDVLDWFFGIVVVVEVALKLIAMGRRFFTQTLWNIFDLIILGLWIIDITKLEALMINPTLLRMLRVLKLIRIIRVMRWLQILDPLILMVKSVRASFSVLIWAMLMLLILVSLLAMIVSALLEPHMTDPNIDLESRKTVFASWGTFTRALETILEITLANWGPPVRMLMNEVSEWWELFFLGYKLTIGFAVVQVIIATFIQQTFKVASRDEEVMIKEKEAAAKAYQKNLGSLFEFLDQSGDGMISKEEFQAVIEDKRVKTWFAALEVDMHDADQLFDMLDTGDGEITQEEFLHGVKALKGGAKGTDVLVLARKLKVQQEILVGLSAKVDYMVSVKEGREIGI